MAITPRGANVASTNNGTSVAVTLPANLEVGDLILVGIGHRVGSSGTITAPAGWTQIDSQINSTTVLAAALFRRIAESGDAGASVTFQSGSGSNTKITAIAQGYGNVDQSAPINGYGGQVNASSTDIVAPAITAPAPSLIVMFASTAFGTTINQTTDWNQSGHVATGGGGANTRNTSAQQSRNWVTANPGSVTAVANDAAVNIGVQLALAEVALTTETGDFALDSIARREQSASIALDSIVLVAVSDSFGADSEIEGAPAAGAVWTDPADQVLIQDFTPTLAFMSPVSSNDMYFEMQLDTVDTFDSPDLRVYRSYPSATGWEYDDGGWQALPLPLPAADTGAEVRFTIPTPLEAGVWFRRVRASI